MTESSISRRDSLRNIAALGVAGAAVAMGAVALTTGSAEAAGQPHMTAALTALQTALTELQAAIPDKNGHRVRAIAFVKSAITETTKGLAAGAM
jgi:hypothetical protein